MNYADNRRDRPAAARENTNGHLASTTAVTGDHTSRATILRDAGANRSALYHYGVAWCQQEPRCDHAAGDYAQMADLAGFPELGVVALLVYQAILQTQPEQQIESEGGPHRLLLGLDEIPDAECWADCSKTAHRTLTADARLDCGCGQAGCCGGNPTVWFVPMTDYAIEMVLQEMHVYAEGRVWALHYHLQQRQPPNQQQPQRQPAFAPTAHHLLNCLHTGKSLSLPSDDLEPAIPLLLRFWDRDDDNIDHGNHSLPPILQLLLMKLLYQVLPSLAMEAVVGACRQLEELSTAELVERRYKSHGAYYLFLKALVLGIRIKPHKRRLQPYYHVPLWDRLWGLYTNGDDDDDDDDMDDKQYSGCSKPISLTDGVHELHQNPAAQFALSLRQLFRGLRDGYILNHETGSMKPVWMPPFLDTVGIRPIYVVGDSHVLSLAWNVLRVPHTTTTPGDIIEWERRVVIPVVVTGLKAWHVRRSTRFFTRASLEIALHRLRHCDCQTILFSAGEIDCREGLGGPLLEGYTQACHKHVVQTVQEYVQALHEIVLDNDNNAIAQILVLPVAPHAHRTRGRKEARASRQETMRAWNHELRRQTMTTTTTTNDLYPRRAIHLLDYAEQLVAHRPAPPAYTLNPIFNADSTHMNSAFRPLLEEAIKQSGCNFDLL